MGKREKKRDTKRKEFKRLVQATNMHWQIKEDTCVGVRYTVIRMPARKAVHVERPTHSPKHETYLLL